MMASCLEEVECVKLGAATSLRWGSRPKGERSLLGTGYSLLTHELNVGLTNQSGVCSASSTLAAPRMGGRCTTKASAGVLECSNSTSLQAYKVQRMAPSTSLSRCHRVFSKPSKAANTLGTFASPWCPHVPIGRPHRIIFSSSLASC